MFVSGDFEDKSRLWFLKIFKLKYSNFEIFKTALMQFISKPKIILAVPKQSLILGYYTTVNHFARYVEIRAFSDPFFTVYAQNRIFPFLDRIKDSVEIQENTDILLSINGEIQTTESQYSGIFYTVDNYKILFLKQERSLQNNM